MRDPEREVGYGITDSWDEIVETLQGALDSIDTELGGYVREFESRVRDRRAHAHTRLLMEAEDNMDRTYPRTVIDGVDLRGAKDFYDFLFHHLFDVWVHSSLWLDTRFELVFHEDHVSTEG
uniref:Uncharacterized protein n=1 Tax=Tanacetum cinerariifolium TaxID=118510 RepID=A0A6L2NVX9_TANCI|nr:hypothetical protein [Tanacetum cinerariifolium]